MSDREALRRAAGSIAGARQRLSMTLDEVDDQLLLISRSDVARVLNWLDGADDA